MTNKFRASYSVLNIWKSGDWERAIKAYFKLEKFTTQAMADGHQWHQKWCDHINKTKTLPIEFGGQKLNNPICEKKIVVELADWLDYVFIIDCYDNPTLHEFKTGKQSSESYAGDEQIRVYGVGATYAGLYVDRAIIHHYDQYSKRYDMSIVWLTDKTLQDAHNWIVTLSSEMHDYFVKNSLYEKFGPNLEKHANNA